MKKTILSLAAILLIVCSANNEVTAQNVTNAGKTLVVYYSYTNKCHEIVESLTTQITADVLRVEPEDKTQKYEANNYAIGTALLNAIKANPNDASSYPAIDPVYCLRFYDRQFITRHKVNSTVFTAFQRQLKDYFESGQPAIKGLPSVAYFADKACLSTGYFGDLISKETGTTAQRHIQDAVIERSKHLLLESNRPVSEIAYELGFEYPQHFTRLFKSRTGMTPNEFRLAA